MNKKKLLRYSLAITFFLVSVFLVFSAGSIQENRHPCKREKEGVYQDGYWYETVALNDRCWLAEDLRKECNNLVEDMEQWAKRSCIYQDDQKEALFYQWEAAMNGSDQEKAQGLCPDGWYIPTDEEWIRLESYLDSQHQSGSNEWRQEGWRGVDAGDLLKGDQFSCSDSNLCGVANFKAKPTGHVTPDGLRIAEGRGAYWWTSSKKEGEGKAWDRFLSDNNSGMSRYPRDFDYGYSIRCIKRN